MFLFFFGLTRKLCENAIARVACKYGFSINDLVTLIELLNHTEANLRETEYTAISNFLCRY
jgi:hypothetical protein